MSHFSRRILNAISVFFVLLLLWSITSAISLAQTTLSPGDIFFVAINSHSSNSFSFVPLVDLSPDTIINFTDKAWDNKSNKFQNNEGIITYTAPTAIAAGTVISYNGADHNGFMESEPGFDISDSGDPILVFMQDKNNPVFIYGAALTEETSTVWSYDGGENTSDIPPTLSKSNNTILSLPFHTNRNVQYDVSNGTEGTAKSLQALVGNDQNWHENNEAENVLTVHFHIQSDNGHTRAHTKKDSLQFNEDRNPPVVINEILADPSDELSGDANGDGIRNDTGDDEFIELVNTRSHDIDITGWQLSTDGGKNVQYKFPFRTILPANQAIVVFGGGDPKGGFGGSKVQTAHGLSLNNKLGKVMLLDNKGNLMQSIAYGGANQPGSNNNESITRSPDITGNFISYFSAHAKDNTPFSPGTKINGSAFGSNYAVGLRGDEGWRFIASPTAKTTFNDLFSNLRTQGIQGSYAPSSDPNIFSWDEHDGGFFHKINSMQDPLSAGKGYAIYVYRDKDLRKTNAPGYFPTIIKTNKDEHLSPVEIGVSSTDANKDGSIDGNEGYNLLGNPFGVSISVDAVIDALGKINPNVNKTVYLWDNSKGNEGSYRLLPAGKGKTIAPFQAFFIHYTTVLSSHRTVTFNRDKLAAKGAAQYPETTELSTKLSLQLKKGQKFDTYTIAFSENGKIGEDLYDGHKLLSLNKDAIQLFSTIGDEDKLAQNELPPINSIDGDLRIPLDYQVSSSGEYTLSWSKLSTLPDDFRLYLIDKKTERKTDLQAAGNVKFNVISKENKQVKKKKSDPEIPKLQYNHGSTNSRFELLLTHSSSQKKQKALKEPVVLSPNYPNPFSSQTTMNLQLKEKMHVKMTIWNIVGQKITTIVDKMMDSGTTHTLTWNVPGNLPSGIYICKVETAGNILTRKMTLVK